MFVVTITLLVFRNPVEVACKLLVDNGHKLLARDMVDFLRHQSGIGEEECKY